MHALVVSFICLDKIVYCSLRWQVDIFYEKNKLRANSLNYISLHKDSNFKDTSELENFTFYLFFLVYSLYANVAHFLDIYFSIDKKAVHGEFLLILHHYKKL